MYYLYFMIKTNNDMKACKVIDADNQKVIETFDEILTEFKLQEYENLGNWDDVSLDRDGDIILWKEL